MINVCSVMHDCYESCEKSLYRDISSPESLGSIVMLKPLCVKAIQEYIMDTDKKWFSKLQRNSGMAK